MAAGQGIHVATHSEQGVGPREQTVVRRKPLSETCSFADGHLWIERSRFADEVPRPVPNGSVACERRGGPIGAASGAIVAAQRLWKTNKPAAIAVMIAPNSVASLVAARKARALRQLR